MQVKSIAECSQKHSAILSTFIKLPFVTKIFVLSCLSFADFLKADFSGKKRNKNMFAKVISRRQMSRRQHCIKSPYINRGYNFMSNMYLDLKQQYYHQFALRVFCSLSSVKPKQCTKWHMLALLQSSSYRVTAMFILLHKT